MSTKRKRLVMMLAGLALIYAITPFVAGLIGTYDPRGPKIFWMEHHDLLYRFGYPFTHDHARYGKPTDPLRDRAWFYGMEGKPMDLDKKMQELQDAIKADEVKHAQN